MRPRRSVLSGFGCESQVTASQRPDRGQFCGGVARQVARGSAGAGWLATFVAKLRLYRSVSGDVSRRACRERSRHAPLRFRPRRIVTEACGWRDGAAPPGVIAFRRKECPYRAGRDGPYDPCGVRGCRQGAGGIDRALVARTSRGCALSTARPALPDLSVAGRRDRAATTVALDLKAPPATVGSHQP